MMRLGNVLRVHHGYAFPGTGFATDPRLPQVVTPANFAPGERFRQNVKSYTGQIPKSFVLPPGSLVITMTDLSKTAATLGLSAVVPGDTIYLHNQRIGRIEITATSIISAKYLHYLCHSSSYREYVVATATGTTVRHTSPSRIEAFECELPSFAVQSAIAEALGALDDKIAANRRAVTSAIALGEAVVRALSLEPRPLDAVASVTMGTSPRGDLLNEDGAGLPFFQGVRDFGPVYPERRVFTEQPVRAVGDGTVLLAVRAPVGKVNLSVGRTSIGRGLAGISSTTQPATLYFAMRAFQSIWNKHQGGGTVFASVNSKEVRSAMLPMPAAEEARIIEANLSPLLARAVSAEQENERLAATRDELLPLLMSGRVTVKDAEQRVEQEV